MSRSPDSYPPPPPPLCHPFTPKVTQSTQESAEGRGPFLPLTADCQRLSPSRPGPDYQTKYGFSTQFIVFCSLLSREKRFAKRHGNLHNEFGKPSQWSIANESILALCQEFALRLDNRPLRRLRIYLMLTLLFLSRQQSSRAPADKNCRLINADPHYRLLMENEQVRVLFPRPASWR